CERLGSYRFLVAAIHRTGERVLAATGSGLWEVTNGRWIQRHDETLTEVMDVVDEGDRMIAASAYGVALGRTEASQATRWDWLSDDLPVNQRFTNTILKLDDDRILAGAEAGAAIHGAESGWQVTSLQNTAVRCLVRWNDRILAGADNGVWWSENGQDWHHSWQGAPVFGLAAAAGCLLTGTEDGVMLSADAEQWRPAGLAGMRIGAVGVSRTDPDHWYAGGAPGGLWKTGDQGQTWVGIPEVNVGVAAITAPGEES
ncbi:MAG: hypothetical protein QGI32_18415, partial [Candidatus Latescibacteria bacterium]|nr:hypothetical protein [Candidatus Latescibacterota bacterium]